MILTRPFWPQSSADAPSPARVSPFATSLTSHHSSIGIESFHGGDVHRPILNGAVMFFTAGAGSQFMWNALHEFGHTYDPQLWGWNGPELLTRVYLRCAEPTRVRLQPPEAFYPIHWQDVAAYAGGDDRARQSRMWRRIMRRSHAVHLWNRKTEMMFIHPDSLLHHLLHKFAVLPSA